MILITVREISRIINQKLLFKDVDFEIRAGEKIGLIGANGCGKTTLLKLITGVDEPDSGEIQRHRTTNIDVLQQEFQSSTGRTLIEEAKLGLQQLYQLQQDSETLAAEIAAETDPQQLKQLQNRYDRIQTELQHADAYHLDHKVDEVLLGLGFQPDHYQRPLGQFSGGEQNRIALARLLLSSPKLLLLDEPTNHLDLFSIEWLEDYLVKSEQAILVVSHDRFFLDKVTNRILEISQRSIFDYRGNFSDYIQQREQRQKVNQRTYEKQQEFIAKTEDFIRRNKYGQKHAQAADRVKKLERIEKIELHEEIQTYPMRFPEPKRSGDWVLQAEQISKSFDRSLFSELSLTIERQERVGIVGPNGSGKTTLLKTLIQELEPDQGTVRLGTNVDLTYFDQQLTSVNPEMTAIEAVRPPHNHQMTPAQIRKVLAKFGIQGDLSLRKVAQMSGGEKNKVALARLAAAEPNFMVLDEPTNHLDLWARDALEKALLEFSGTILFVSHDRYFLDRIASRVLVYHQERWQDYSGNYSDFISFKKNQAASQDAQLTKKALSTKPKSQNQPDSTQPDDSQDLNSKSAKRKRKFPYRKVEDLETEIHDQEVLIEELENQLANPEAYRQGAQIKEIKLQYDQAKQDLEQLYLHWNEAIELN